MPGTIVGRTEELQAIEHALVELGRGESVALEVRGELGIGKTRLLAELAARADGLGYLVLSGSASELEADLPFWVLVDALDDYVAALEPHRRDAMGEDVLAELATVFPALSRFAAAGTTAVPHPRYRTYRAVRELLERLTATKPLVLVLDDVHWADPASAELLGTLLRRPPDAAVLLALAVRSRQVSDRLAGALERAYRMGTVHRLALGPLTRPEARASSSARPSTSPQHASSIPKPVATRSISSSSPARSIGSRQRALASLRWPVSTCRLPSPVRWPRSSRCSPTRHDSCSRAPPWPVTLRARAGGGVRSRPRAASARGLDAILASTSSARPMYRAGFDSGTRSFDGPSRVDTSGLAPRRS